MLFLQCRFFNMPACSRRREYPVTLASRSAHPN
jgi:hypothetical protein